MEEPRYIAVISPLEARLIAFLLAHVDNPNGPVEIGPFPAREREG